MARSLIPGKKDTLQYYIMSINLSANYYVINVVIMQEDEESVRDEEIIKREESMHIALDYNDDDKGNFCRGGIFR